MHPSDINFNRLGDMGLTKLIEMATWIRNSQSAKGIYIPGLLVRANNGQSMETIITQLQHGFYWCLAGVTPTKRTPAEILPVSKESFPIDPNEVNPLLAAISQQVFSRFHMLTTGTLVDTPDFKNLRAIYHKGKGDYMLLRPVGSGYTYTYNILKIKLAEREDDETLGY